MTAFPDHFSAVAANYARYRPTYPAALFEWIASLVPEHRAAWDCGCGNGQATIPLTRFFQHVFATDPSATQVALGPVNAQVTWSVATAEASGLEPASVDIVTVAQALHWFDLPKFWIEVRRVVRPGGAFVAWTYGVPFAEDSQLAAKLLDFHDNVVGPYWPVERGHVSSRYRAIDMPFAPIAAPFLELSAHWTADELAGYLRTWSAVGRYIAQRGVDPVTPFMAELANIWRAERQTIRWPVTILAGRTTPEQTER